MCLVIIILFNEILKHSILHVYRSVGKHCEADACLHYVCNYLPIRFRQQNTHFRTGLKAGAVRRLAPAMLSNR